MTETDYTAIAAITRLLQDEIAALRRGDLAQVEALVARKTELSAALEAAGPAIAAALAADPSDTAVRQRMVKLNELIETDRALLERMTQVTGAMVGEVARIRDRHGLRGIYSAKGTQRAPEPVPVQRFDHSV